VRMYLNVQELHDKKRAMANIIELSNLSYEARDNFQMEIAAIEQVRCCIRLQLLVWLP
jgi:hypothetical protein